MGAASSDLAQVVATPPAHGKAPLWEVLGAPGAVAGGGEAIGLYEPMIGSWEVAVVDDPEGGAPRRQVGEWHFAWVLEGRAIQDVFVVPARGGRKVGEAPGAGNRYGTSIRVFDPTEGVWHVTWVNPVTGAHNRLVGRQVWNDIVQEGVEPDGSRIRWSFREITPTSFHWLGEDSQDDGQTWRLVVEFFARRVG
jgi:hypothetical protein